MAKKEEQEVEIVEKKPVKKSRRSRKSKTKKTSKKTSTSKALNRKPSLRKEKDMAVDFAESVHRKFNAMIKASVLFGSQAKNSSSSGSDIDIILVIDDASINWDLELISWYREELGKIIASKPYGEKLHVNTVKLTTWWHDLLHGDPVIINILRYGEALIDIGGFFNPLKALLISGKIRSTPEAVYAALQRSPGHLARSRAAEISAIEGVYWSMIDSAQAALITAGKIPPSPEHIPEMLSDVFVSNGMLKMSAVQALRDLYNLHKSIMHREISDIKGAEIDQWQETAEKFLSDMTSIIDQLLEKQS
jgi:uncharacterized protein (UPF0332 family)/predicted nucleotidyltransferase